jgi:ApbE superfamily uncharacterized protein (UPF0280 family)
MAVIAVDEFVLVMALLEEEPEFETLFAHAVIARMQAAAHPDAIGPMSFRKFKSHLS